MKISKVIIRVDSVAKLDFRGMDVAQPGSETLPNREVRPYLRSPQVLQSIHCQ